MNGIKNKLHSTYLKRFQNSVIDIQIKAKRILYANFLMILVSIALFPFTLDETIFLPAAIILSVAGFLLSIYSLKNGWIVGATWLHVIILSCVGSFLHCYISDSYGDSLTFILVSFIFLVNCSMVSVGMAQFLFMAVCLFLSMALAPLINVNLGLHLSPENQIENAALFSSFLVFLLLNMKDNSNLLSTAKLEAEKVKMREKALKEANERLYESEKKYRLLADNATDVIWTMDLEFHLTYISPSVSGLQGFTAKEMMDKPIDETMTSDSIKKILSLYETRIKYLESGDRRAWESVKFEAELLCKDGSAVWAEINAQFIEGSDTSAHHIIGISRDISERKRTQETIIQSEKMMSVGGLAAGMAHEINNPLAGVIQNANVAINRLTDKQMPANETAAESAGTRMEAIAQFMESRDILKMLNLIVDSGMRMSSIVENMLSFARKSDLSFSTHDPVQLVDKALELAATDYDLKKEYDFKNIAVEKEYETKLPFISCQATKIQQVILNILTNGAYAMFDSPGVKPPKFIIRLKYEPGPDMFRIEIEDNGPGMDHKTSKRIFDPFFTTKPAGVGTGLGLSVSYFIVTEDHKGTMTVSSNTGKGAKFVIRLPVKMQT